MSTKCTYEVYKDTGEMNESRPCGRTVTAIYQKGETHYPRCPKHDTTKVRTFASQNGFDRREP